MQSASPRCTRLILAALLGFSLTACSGSSPTGTAGSLSAGMSSQPGPVAAQPSAPARSSSEPAAGPPPASTREIQGYFTSPTTRTSLRLWRGPNDQPGFERLTRVTVEVQDVPEYSMAASTVQFAGVCRTSAGLDQVLLVFHPERRGGERFGVVRYDTKRNRLTLVYTPRDITQDGGARLDCSGGRVILPEGAPALPCTCPWRDDPDHLSQPVATDASTGTGEILILPEEPGGTP